MSVTTSAFLDAVRKSGVIDAPQLDAWLERQRRDGRPPGDPAELAARLRADGLLTDFQARQLLRGKWNGFLLGNYRILDKIGSGGMGTVYLAEHCKLRRKAAIKVLPVTTQTPPGVLARFYREARAVATVSHPNVVQAHDIDQAENVHYLAMEYVDGVSLQALVAARGPLPAVQAADYARQAAAGLDEVHRNGLVHRDLKPANLMVNRTGVVKVLDLGLAMFALDGDEGITRRHGGEGVLGTADYLAPEQAVDPHVVDIRADIYSLGATLYFLLTGRAPFPEGTLAQKLLAHQTREPYPLRAARPDLPFGLEAVVARMMAKDPAGRFQTPAEVAYALEPFARAASTAPPESLFLRPRPETVLANGPSTTPSMLPSLPGPPPPVPPLPVDEPPHAEGRSPLLVGSLIFGGLCLVAALGVGIWLAVSALSAPIGTVAATDPASTMPARPEETAEAPPDFHDGFRRDGLQLNGRARLEGNRLRLTPRENEQAGSAFTRNRIAVRRLATEFTFQITEPQADGFAFVLTSAPPTSLGQKGNGLGYVGIERSIAVGFNFWANQEIRIGVNGAFPGGVLSKSLDGTGIDLRSGRVHLCRVTLEEDGWLKVRLTDKQTNAAAEMKVVVSRPRTLGGYTAHAGFTGGTGGGSAVQDILTWTFDADPPAP